MHPAQQAAATCSRGIALLPSSDQEWAGLPASAGVSRVIVMRGAKQ